MFTVVVVVVFLKNTSFKPNSVYIASTISECSGCAQTLKSIHCMHTRTMDIHDGPDKTLGLKLIRIHHHELLLERFAHMRYVYPNLVC